MTVPVTITITAPRIQLAYWQVVDASVKDGEVIAGDCLLRLPTPEGDDSERAASADLPVGTLLHAVALYRGGWDYTVVSSPVLVVEEGAEWEFVDFARRRTIVRVVGAREVGVEEVGRLCQSGTDGGKGA